MDNENIYLKEYERHLSIGNRLSRYDNKEHISEVGWHRGVIRPYAHVLVLYKKERL